MSRATVYAGGGPRRRPRRGGPPLAHRHQLRKDEALDIPIYQVDAFASRPFAGNPAAVCPLEAWLDDAMLQAIAGENNLSETAFFVREGDGFHLRWFTPEVEVDLCGHATLATSHIIFRLLEPEREEIRFRTRSGSLQVTRSGARIELQLPAKPPEPAPMPEGLAEALGATPVEVLVNHPELLAVYEEEETVRCLRPDFRRLREVDLAVIVTAPGSDCDLVSRCFAPLVGIDEDPVTGAAHCVLVPYWADRLGKRELHARQVSKRGGELRCRHLGERVALAGEAVLVLTGTLHL